MFIYSYLLDKDIWRSQIELLKKDFRCISIDLPVQGKVENVEIEGNISLKVMAKRIILLLRELGISEYTCIGASFGGMVIPYMCVLDKDKVSAAVMINTYIGNEMEDVKQLLFSFLDIATLYHEIPEGLIDQVKPLFFHRITEENSKYCRIFSNKLRNLKGNKLDSLIKIGRSMLEDEESLLEKIKTSNIPVCLINGEDNILYPYYRNYEICKDIENIEIVKLENVEYIFSERDNIEIYNILQKFLLKQKKL